MASPIISEAVRAFVDCRNLSRIEAAALTGADREMLIDTAGTTRRLATAPAARDHIESWPGITRLARERGKPRAEQVELLKEEE